MKMKKLFFIFLFTTFSCCAIVAQKSKGGLAINFFEYALKKTDVLIKTNELSRVWKTGTIPITFFSWKEGIQSKPSNYHPYKKPIGYEDGKEVLPIIIMSNPRIGINPIHPWKEERAPFKLTEEIIAPSSAFDYFCNDNLNKEEASFELTEEIMALPSALDYFCNDKPAFIDSGSKSLERGFILEEHNVAPPNTPSVHEEHINDIQIEDVSQKWKEKLRKKVLDKINKINKIESKGNFHMIYGYILKFNEDGEYCINYAA